MKNVISFYCSLRPKILVIEMDVSRCILVLDTSIFIHFDDKYFRTEGVVELYDTVHSQDITEYDIVL